MKKVYIQPSVETYNVNAVNMLANSLPVGGENGPVVDPEVGQGGREDNTPSRPNIWEQSW
jgi:hypothetical protein